MYECGYTVTFNQILNNTFVANLIMIVHTGELCPAPVSSNLDQTLRGFSVSMQSYAEANTGKEPTSISTLKHSPLHYIIITIALLRGFERHLNNPFQRLSHSNLIMIPLRGS